MTDTEQEYSNPHVDDVQWEDTPGIVRVPLGDTWVTAEVIYSCTECDDVVLGMEAEYHHVREVDCNGIFEPERFVHRDYIKFVLPSTTDATELSGALRQRAMLYEELVDDGWECIDNSGDGHITFERPVIIE